MSSLIKECINMIIFTSEANVHHSKIWENLSFCTTSNVLIQSDWVLLYKLFYTWKHVINTSQLTYP